MLGDDQKTKTKREKKKYMGCKEPSPKILYPSVTKTHTPTLKIYRHTINLNTFDPDR